MQKEGRIFLISKLPWCHARRFFKLAGEVRNILEAAGDGNVADAHFALCEKLLGASNPAVDDVVDERTSRVFFEEMGQIIGVQIHMAASVSRSSSSERCDSIYAFTVATAVSWEAAA